MVLTKIKTTAESSSLPFFFDKDKPENISDNLSKRKDEVTFTPNFGSYVGGDYSATAINNELALYFQIGTNSHKMGDSGLIKNINRLNSYLDLKYNWNNNNADPFSKLLVEKCIKIIKEIKYQPEIFPTARDSIQFEYEKKNGHYLEFEIFEDNILYLEEMPNEEMIERELSSEEEIYLIVKRFYA